MPWLRLSDNYIDHPKFLALSDGAFRLWHEGMAFCRKHLTDGLITTSSLHGFRYYKPPRAKELVTPPTAGAAPLWEKVPGGVRVHDYLFWNLPKADEQAEKDAATARMRRLRHGRRSPGGSGEHAGERSDESSTEQPGERSPNVLDRMGSDRISSLEKSEKPFLLPTARSKRPVFKGQRLVVFEWQLDDLVQILGKHADSFDFHEWFFALDTVLVASHLVLPKRDGGVWLQAELIKEAKKRRFSVAEFAKNADETDDGDPWAWQCKCGEIHEGSSAQRGQCLKTRPDRQEG